MNELKLILQEGHILYKTARATNHPITDDIVLYLPNIMKDIDGDVDNFWVAIDHLFLIELTCSIITKEINNFRPLCGGNGRCPINAIFRKVGLNHEIKVDCQKSKKIEDTPVKAIYYNKSDYPSITSAVLARRIENLTNEVRK